MKEGMKEVIKEDIKLKKDEDKMPQADTEPESIMGLYAC